MPFYEDSFENGEEPSRPVARTKDYGGFLDTEKKAKHWLDVFGRLDAMAGKPPLPDMPAPR